MRADELEPVPHSGLALLDRHGQDRLAHGSMCRRRGLRVLRAVAVATLRLSAGEELRAHRP